MTAWFRGLKISSVLFMGFAAMILMMELIGYTGYKSIKAVHDNLERTFTESLPAISYLVKTDRSLHEVLAAERSIIFADAKSDIFKEVLNNYEKSLVDAVSLWEKYKAIPMSNEKKELAVKYEKARDEWKALSLQVIEKRKADSEEGRQSAAELSLKLAKEKFEIMQALLDELEKMEMDQASHANSMRSAAYRKPIITLFAFMIAGLCIGLLFSFFIGKRITRPIKKLTEAVSRVADKNDLEVSIEAENRSDEAGILMTGFNTMLSNLRYQKQQMLENTEFLQEQNQEIADGAKTLGATISEISATAAELATSATETATSISEISTTLEEVRQTAHLSNEKAGQVLARSNEVSQTSEAGKKSTEDTINGIKRIREEMEYVAESIVKLSEQTQSIGEIISAVNDLADQSNLLSVNASIEAAKAGEHGKGFAVVAQEVKSLAEQSKDATNQVKNILHDIQKATSAAVMATERGSKAVEHGVNLSAQAGEAIRTLADSVTESAQAAFQIASSSKEQLTGMDQLADAMASIKDASNQNVDGARQLEDAVRGLDALARRLNEIAGKEKGDKNV